MVYKLDEADKLCGVTYIDWSKKYSPIPKATCEMLKQQCGSGEGSDNTPELSCEDIKKLLKGGGNDDIPELSCEEIKKLLKGEDKPKEEKPKEDEKPKEEEFSILKVMPKVEDSFSIVTHKNGMVTSVADNSPEKKEAFERNVINLLKSKLPEGAVVEAVLGEPFYKEGSELIAGKTNYTIHTRVTLNGKVYEQEYSVPTIIEEQSKIKDDIKKVTELFGFSSLLTLHVTRGNTYKVPYIKENVENTLNGNLINMFPSSNFLTYKDIFTIDNIYIKEKMDRENEPKMVTMVVDLTLYNGDKKTLEIPKEPVYVDYDATRPLVNPRIPRPELEDRDETDREILEILDNHEFNYGYITPTNDGNIGSLVGNNGKPITPEELEKQSKVFTEDVKKVLGDKVNKVKVDLVQLLNVGDYIGESRTKFNSAFRVDIALEKSNGSNVTLSELVTTTVIETL